MKRLREGILYEHTADGPCEDVLARKRIRTNTYNSFVARGSSKKVARKSIRSENQDRMEREKNLRSRFESSIVLRPIANSSNKLRMRVEHRMIGAKPREGLSQEELFERLEQDLIVDDLRNIVGTTIFSKIRRYALERMKNNKGVGVEWDNIDGDDYSLAKLPSLITQSRIPNVYHATSLGLSRAHRIVEYGHYSNLQRESIERVSHSSRG